MKFEFNPIRENKIKIFLLGGIILLLLLAGTWFIFPSLFSPNADSFSIQNCNSISRESYGLASAVFELLPSPPKCFYSVVIPFQEGKLVDPFFFNSDYYLQPEFFPAFKKEGMSVWKKPTAGYWGAVGYGAFPYDLKLTLRPGETTRTRFFIFSSFGIRTFQGMRMQPIFPNPLDANHISIQFISPTENDGFILGPSFPKFDSKWVHPIDIEITAKTGIPAETLRVQFRVKAPSDRIDNEGVQKYGGDYYAATSYVGERTPAGLTVQIIPRIN